MGLFTQHRDQAVQSIILNLVNNNCPSLKAMVDGPRLEQRVNLSIPVVVVPIHHDVPIVCEAMSSVTKDFSTTGCSITVDHPHVPKEAVLVFKSRGKAYFIRAQSRHLAPMGGGFFQCGFKLVEVFDASMYPDLRILGETL